MSETSLSNTSATTSEHFNRAAAAVGAAVIALVEVVRVRRNR